MYCERCGKLLDETLNFCNACGAQLKKKEADRSRSALTNLTNVLGAVSVVGLGVLVALIAILLDKVDRFEPVFAFSAVYLAVLFGICFMIMRQVSKLVDADLRARENSGAQKSAVQLPPRTTNQLEEFREPASVVENTTRTLAGIPRGER